MKKLFCFVALLLAFSCILASCKKDPDQGNQNNDPPTPEHTHAFGEWTTVTEATCASEGLKERVCECGEKESEALPATGIHTEETVNAIDPTCTDTGLTEGKKCSVCDTVIVEQETVPALGHDEYTYTEKDESCNVFNVTACHRCDHLDKVNTGVVSHTFGDWELSDSVIDGSPCGLDRVYLRACEDCGVTENKTEPATGHNYTSTVISVHSLESIGEIKYTCQNPGCDSSYSEYENHEYTASVTAPTCTAQGYTTYTCSCGHSYVADYTDILGHIFTVYEPITCPDGVCPCEWIPVSVAHCDRGCGTNDTKTYESLGHSYGSWTVATDPTEESEGLLIRICNSCDCHVGETILPALTQKNADNGIYVLTIVDATYEQEGSKTFTYEIDGQTFSWIITIPVMDYPYSQGLRFTSYLDGTNACCVVSGIGTCTDIDIVIPPISPEGKKVISISNEAFYKNESIASVTVPNGVTSIGKESFWGCSSLTNIKIPNSVSYIGDYAFYYCTSLTSIEIPASITSISNSAFKGCTSLASVTFDEDSQLASIGQGAFYDCTSLIGIEIPASVTSIGSVAFYDCTSLTSIEIPASVTSIGSSAFRNCSSLNEIEVSAGNACYRAINGSLYDYEGTTLMQYAIGKTDTTFAISEGVTSIGYAAFSNCTSLTSIEIPYSVTSIGSVAFYDCSSLYKIINNSNLAFEFASREHGDIAYYAKMIVDKDGNKTYNNTDTVEYLETDDNFLFRIANGKYTLIAYTGFEETVTIPTDFNGNEYKINNIRGVKRVIIPDGITSIGDYAFLACTLLTSIEIPASVISIDNHAFRGCSSLTSVIFAEDSQLASIGDSAFTACSSLTSIEIPEGVTYIGGSAFSGCSSLTSIEIPASVKTIRHSAFEGCTSLTSINIPASVTSIGNAAFSNCTSLTEIKVAEGNTKYKDIDGNLYRYDGTVLIQYAVGKTDTIFEIPASVTSIDYAAFSNCTSLTNIEIPDSVTSIGYAAFYGCTALTNIEIPYSVTSISDSVFEGCTSLISVTFDEDSQLASISSHVFSNCISLTNIEIPDGVTSIGYNAFSDCSSLTSIEIPEGVTSIYKYAFSGCSSLTSIEIPASVTSIGEYAFSNCLSLTSIEIPAGVTYIGDYAFYYCISLTSIEIPASVTSIGSYSFYYLASLTDVCYGGSEVDWAAISIGSNNYSLTVATIHYNYVPEE